MPLRRWKLITLAVLTALGILLSARLFPLIPTLQAASQQPIDGIFVLGGSVRREIYLAEELIPQYPHIPILISNGSKDPCILLIFKRSQVPLDQVWLEKCADNTFQNFVYGVPLLKQWGVKHIKLITSQTHLPRAQWMAQIQFGIQGIWVEIGITPEVGVPGNRESGLKTLLDVGRSALWAIASPWLDPQFCPEVTPLSQVNLQEWLGQGFKCEDQADLDDWVNQLQNHYHRYFVN